MIRWCRDCHKDIRWDKTTPPLERVGRCGCSSWTAKVKPGAAYKALYRRRQFLPASFEIKGPAPRGCSEQGQETQV